MAALTELVRALHDPGIAVEDIALRRPTLDEVFLISPAARDDGGAAAGRRTARCRHDHRDMTMRIPDLPARLRLVVADGWTLTRRDLAHWAPSPARSSSDCSSRSWSC